MKKFKKFFVRVPILVIILFNLIFLLINFFHLIQEEIIIKHISKNIVSSGELEDIEILREVLLFVNNNVSFNKGKRGYFRASSIEILTDNIGGQCGEFARLSIALLNEFGIPAHRVYLFTKKDGKRFSNHVLIEVSIDGTWILADPLYNFIFYDSYTKDFFNIRINEEESYIKFINKFHGVALKRCDAPDTFIYTYPIDFKNINDYSLIYWERIPLKKISRKIFKLIFHKKNHQIPLPFILEKPYLFKFVIFIILFLFFTLIYFEILGKQKKKF
ncbi:transglutaminase domain-containing protein [Candidatus Dependentiae bacterium]|nr:transglutaminase domain-containing protein [Candidatus Dependentiae bacterium]